MNNKKVIFGIIVFVLLSIITCIFVVKYIENEYKKSMYTFTSNVFDNVNQKYPQVEEELINNLFNNNNESNVNLKKYGINKENIDMMIDKNALSNKIALIVIISMFFIIAIAIIIFCIYENIQKKKIKDINKYISELLKGDYSLDLIDIDESDISKLKKQIYNVTILLKEKNEFLNTQNKEVEKLLSDISHQIKTPLTSLYIINELLTEKNIAEENKKEFLANMQKELTKIEWLIKNLLNLAKLDSKTLQLKKEEIGIQSLLVDCVDNFSIISEIKGINIRVVKNEEFIVNIDKKWSEEAINNLIKNAIEHKSKNITITYEKNYIYTKIEISDDGEGIEKADINHIFDRFYKASNSNNESIGLGLAFVKSIITNQNGEIRVESKKDVGTTFIIKLYNQVI